MSVNVSSLSLTTSAAMLTETVWLVSPALKLSDPLADL